MSDEDSRGLSAAQASGFTDMAPDEFRRAAHQVVDMIADYLEHVEEFAVLPAVEPGSLRPLFPPGPPNEPEPLDAILGDVEALIEPNVTHWQHPGFFGWFATTASGAGMLGEFLTAALGSNAMLWRASPVATELEQVVVDWFRQALGLPEAFDGLLTDTASTSTLIALAAAREAAGLQVAAMGLAGRPDVPPPVVYTSVEANLSVEKACMTLGIGRANVRRIPPDEAYRMDVGALAAAITDDRAAGRRPIAIVPTIGTTSTTSVDPVAAIVDLAERERLWVHVDAAYAGAVALIPERRGPFAGWERADSVTMNPHKWLFTPLDASVLLTRRMDLLRAAFSLVPEYLGGLTPESPARDYNEYTPQLGRRFRALKLWILLRWFGLDGLRRRIERHIAFAQEFANWVAADPDFEVLAPVPFSTVCFRYRPSGIASSGGEALSAEPVLEALNVALENAVNATGRILLSHTRLRGRYVLRLAVGNLRTEERHVRQAWEIVREAATALGRADPDPEGAGAADVGAATDQGTAMGAKIVV